METKALTLLFLMLNRKSYDMRFIQQLTETINPQLSDIVSSVSSDNMLEQFYAIYIMRLCDKALLAQLSVMTDSSNLFEKVWSQKSHRELICYELSVEHHLEEEVTLQLISKASPLVYQQIKQQADADGVSIFDFLQPHIDDIKMFFPIWIDSVISKAILSGEPQADVEPPQPPSTPVEVENDEFAEMATSETTVQSEDLDNVKGDEEEQPAYADLPKGKKRSRSKGKKPKPPRRKKPATAKNNTRHKKILIIAIPFLILNLIVIGVLLWLKKTADTETNGQNEVILTAQQDPANEDYPVPPAQPIDPNNQNMNIPPQQQPPMNGQNMGMPPAQAQQVQPPMNGQNMGVPPAQPPRAQPPVNQNVGVPPVQPPQAQPPVNQNMGVPPAQPPQPNYQNMGVPPAQPQQPMDMPPPNAQMNMPPQQPMSAYNEPPVVNNPPPQQSMSITQSPNETVFEFDNNENNGGISEAQLDELTNVEIISEKLENEAQ